jgi:hypothetical protein
MTLWSVFVTVLMLSGVVLVGLGIWHFNDPPVEVVGLYYQFPSKVQYTTIGFGVTLIVMGLRFREKE